MSDNELDAELLALAGDDSSSDEDEVQQTSRQSRSPSDHAEEVVEKSRSPPRRGVAQKPKSRGAKSARKSRDDDSEEEGEASAASSPGSLGSAAMSQSDSDAGNLDDNAPLYPIDGKFSSEKDRQHIMSLSEIQREEILAERATEVQYRAQDLQLKRMLQAREREEHQVSDRKKRKAAAADLEDGQRKSSRQKVKASDPLEAYKRQRELKGAERARNADRRRERSPSGERGYSDRDAEGESEVEWDDRAPTKARDDPTPDLRDFQHACIGRTNFGEFLYVPSFQTSLRGCYCRISVGQGAYKLAQIKGFGEGTPYIIETKAGKVYTDGTINVAFGKTEKEIPFSNCSDGKLTEAEFDKFKKTLAEDNVRFPTKKQLNEKTIEVDLLHKYIFTDEEITRKMSMKKAGRVKYETHQKDRLTRRRDEAAARGDDATVARCNQELLAYDPNGVKTGKPNIPNKAIEQQERLAALNRANRKANSENIRKAQLAEKRVVQKARDEAIAKARQRDADAAEAAKNKLLGVPKDDLFGEGSDISRAGTPANGVSTPKKGVSRAGTPVNGLQPKKSLGGLRKRNMDDEVMAAMDLGIEIDI